jgi:hypothetical protein
MAGPERIQPLGDESRALRCAERRPETGLDGVKFEPDAVGPGRSREPDAGFGLAPEAPGYAFDFGTPHLATYFFFTVTEST